MEMRTGKTICAISLIAKDFKKGQREPNLIICPVAAMGVWSTQIKEHLRYPSQVKIIGKKSTLKYFAPNRMNFFIVNLELFWRRKELFRDIRWNYIIIDESHRIKKHSSKQAQSAHILGRRAKKRLILTGTPIGNNELDLFAQFRFLDPTIFGTSWDKFTKKYARRSGWGGYKFVPRARKKKELLDKVKTRAIYISAKSALNLPPDIDLEIKFPLSPKVRKIYDELENNYYTKYDGQSVTTPLAITNLLRLHQVTGGFLPLDTGEIVQLHQDKLLIFLDWLQDYPQKKLVVFTRFVEEIVVIQEMIDRPTSVIDGGTKDITKVWRNFQATQKPEILIAQIKTGGIAIELSASDTAVFYSNSYSYIDYRQARFRIYKKGQKKNSFFPRLIAENTVDVDIHNSLKDKGQTAQNVFDHLKRRKN